MPGSILTAVGAWLFGGGLLVVGGLGYRYDRDWWRGVLTAGVVTIVFGMLIMGWFLTASG